MEAAAMTTVVAPVHADSPLSKTYLWPPLLPLLLSAADPMLLLTIGDGDAGVGDDELLQIQASTEDGHQLPILPHHCRSD